MTLKKRTYGDDEIPIFDDAMIYKRGDYWQFRMWLAGEGKYAIKSLKTRSRSTAIDKGEELYIDIRAAQKAGKKYFSLTTKQGVAKYVTSRQRDVDAGLIVKGRLGTIKIHLEHWLDFIGRDTKLKELERTDCLEYYHERKRVTSKKKLPVSQSTVLNEQSTINAMMSWLFKNNETTIDHFEFKKLPKQDIKDDRIRRATFEPKEIDDIGVAIGKYWDKKKNKLEDEEWRARTLACYYFLIASVTGLRTGEQRQLKWSDVEHYGIITDDGDEAYAVKIRVRAETSKVRQSRIFIVRDNQYFQQLRDFHKKVTGKKDSEIAGHYVFSLDGKTQITERAILYHFGKIIALAEIDITERDIVPYSFRHYFITQKLVHGLNHRQVADICGTSITQIEKTYYHVDEEMMSDTAMLDHDKGNDGIIVRELEE